jgi:Fe-S-cluster containining protein
MDKTETQNEIQRILKEARESLSDYCINVCKAFCCRTGYIKTREEKARFIAGERFEKMFKMKKIEKSKDGSYVIHLREGGCPRLDKKTCFCTIHTHELKPITCEIFPINVKGDYFFISQRCPAIRESKLYLFTAQLAQLRLKKGNDEPILIQ